MSNDTRMPWHPPAPAPAPGAGPLAQALADAPVFDTWNVGPVGTVDQPGDNHAAFSADDGNYLYEVTVRKVRATGPDRALSHVDHLILSALRDRPGYTTVQQLAGRRRLAGVQVGAISYACGQLAARGLAERERPLVPRYRITEAGQHALAVHEGNETP